MSYKVRGKRDGTGSYRNSYRKKVEGKELGRRQEAGENKYKIVAQETNEVFWEGCDEEEFKEELNEWKSTHKFTGDPIPIRVYKNGELKAEFNTGEYSFNKLEEYND